MKFTKKLNLIGYWNDKLQDGSRLYDGQDSDEYARYPSPMDLVSPGWLGKELPSLINYLNSGAKCVQYCGWSTCRFLCENREIGGSELTDGVWVWPDGLAHYVEVHDVFLPMEFVETARNNGFQIPKDVYKICDQIWNIPTNRFLFFFRRITHSRFCWFVRWKRKGHDKSFWIEWGKSILQEEKRP